jgi:alpha-mannosidase
VPTPEGQCIGHHEFEYALLVGADELDDGALLRESQDYRRGFFVIVGAAAEFDPPLTLDGDVVFSSLKGAEDGDGLIMRCFNPADAAVTARVESAASLWRTRLDETTDEPVPDGAFEVGPFQIATLRLKT